MILFLSTNDTLGGAAMVTFRLVEALRRQGRDARMLVARKDSDRAWVDVVNPMRFKMAKVAERARIYMANGFSRDDLWRVSDASTGCGAASHPWVTEARSIVLGWTCQGLLSLNDIRRLERTDKRILWWMHDLWCATGICHLPPAGCERYTTGCGRCPLLHWRAGKHDLSARTFARKMDVLRSFRIRYLAVSSWQRDRCAESPIFEGKKIEVLGHPLQVEKFAVSPMAEGLHRISSLPGVALGGNVQGEWASKKIIAMGAARLDDPIKGLSIAVEALNSLADRHGESAVAVLFGALKSPDALAELKFPYVHIPRIDAELLPELYAAATVVLSTSHFETMGATLMEGMAGGATPVTFGTGGQTDIVVDGHNGYVARYPSAESVAECVDRALCKPFDRHAQHRSVASRFGADAIARQFLTLLP